MSDAKLFTYSRMTLDEYLELLRETYIRAWDAKPDTTWHPDDLQLNLETVMSCTAAVLDWQRRKARP